MKTVLIGVLLFLCFSLAGKVESCYPALGLRWKKPLTSTQTQELRAKAGEQGLAVDFWREEYGQASSALHSVDSAMTILFNGEGSLCYPAEFVAGGYPGSEDVFGCSISTSLAWKLLGSNDIVGQKVEWNGQTRIVRGVFSESEDVLVLGIPLENEFEAAELSGDFEADRRAQVQTLVQQAGLSEPDSAVYGQNMRALAVGLCLAPALLACVLWAKGCICKLRDLPPAHRQVLWWGIGMGTALCLPFLLKLLPVWLIPARWSDFSFWPDLVHTGEQCLNEWLTLIPAHKDVLAKRAGYLLKFCSAVTCCLTAEWYGKARAS